MIYMLDDADKPVAETIDGTNMSRCNGACASLRVFMSSLSLIVPRSSTSHALQLATHSNVNKRSMATQSHDAHKTK